ncbi:MAG: IPT/TIG domain-containing protein [Dehalococcoidia bacterium]
MWSKTPISKDSVKCSDEVSTSCYTVVGEGRFPADTKEVTVSFTIPEASFGINFLQFQRSYRPENPYGFAFSVVPGLTVTQPTCTPRSTVTIKGTGFPAKNKNIKVSFDGNDTGLSILTNELGSFTGEFTIPDTMAGNHQFKATDENLFLGDITASLQVGPTISLQPEHPEIGSEVTLTGCGFAARSTIAIKYDDIAVSNSPTTGDTGNFTDKFIVPESSTDTHVITATDKAGNVATFGLPLEGTAPSVPNPISPAQERFGWFGSQLVVFNWSEVSDPSGVTYSLEIDNSLRFFPLEPGMRKTGLTEPNCVMRLDPGTYYWRVKAIDGAGNESDWSLSPYPFQVGLLSGLYLAIGAIIFVIIFIFIIRAFFRRVREYYK